MVWRCFTGYGSPNCDFDREPQIAISTRNVKCDSVTKPGIATSGEGQTPFDPHTCTTINTSTSTTSTTQPTPPLLGWSEVQPQSVEILGRGFAAALWGLDNLLYGRPPRPPDAARRQLLKHKLARLRLEAGDLNSFGILAARCCCGLPARGIIATRCCQIWPPGCRS